VADLERLTGGGGGGGTDRPPADIKHSTRTIGYTPRLRQLSTH